MLSRYDLHSHSTFSDGTLTPRELVQRAAAAGVRVLALTDHDTTGGIDEAQAAACATGIELVAGVEISVTWEGAVIHVLGLGVDPHCGELQQGLAGLREVRAGRAEEMGRRLEQNGIPGAFPGARALSSGHLVSRTHFARFLVGAGYVSDLRKVFQHYLGRGKPGYVASEWATLEQTLSWVTAAGGQAVIAHPARYLFTNAKLRRLLNEFVELGGVGLEVVSGSHNRDDCLRMARLTAEFDLLASAGSDYHGPENPWVELGRLMPMPETVSPIWRSWPQREDLLSA
jgi:predicted metal-dependent phosphoesterase TrpH